MVKIVPTVVGDWGTSRLRLFKIVNNTVVARANGPGVGVASQSSEDVLRDTLRDIGISQGVVLLCGMAGSRMGLIESGYIGCPVSKEHWRAAAVSVRLDAFDVAIMPGVKTRNLVAAPDVMRGEEAQVYGAMAIRPDLAHGHHVFVLPGTHSKWVETRDGAITHFHTFPTGELFAFLSRSSTMAGALHESVAAADCAGFDHGIDRNSNAASILATIFEARAGQLIDGRNGRWANDFLSGALIAEEACAGLTMWSRRTTELVVIGAPDLTQLYARAMTRHGALSHLMDGDACALAGLGIFEPAAGEM